MSDTYLPAGSRIAVQDSKGASQWYTTKKDIPLTGDEQTVLCPMRSGRNVLTTQHQGWSVFFLPDQVRQKLSKEEENTAKNLELYQLVYDIPANQGIPSPCPWLYPIAIRINLSCWIIPKERIPYARLHALTEQGANWHLTKFDASEAVNLVSRAVDSLRAEVQEAVERADQSQRDAERLLVNEDGTPKTDTVKARKQYLARIEQIKERTETLFKNLTSAATVFGINQNRLRKDQATTSIQAIAAGMKARAAQFVATVNAIGNHNTTDGNALVNGAASGQIPWQILADYAQDQGLPEGEQLATVMSEPSTNGDSHLFTLGGEDTDGE